jgi:hypothetical protein
MIHGFESLDSRDDQVAVLAKEVGVRVLNCSATGCLVEATAAVPIGTIATLRVAFGGRDFDDLVRIVRCQRIEGAGELYHVGAQFVCTTPPYAGNFRYVLRREVSQLAGWLRKATEA